MAEEMTLQDRIDAVVARYKPQIEQLEAEGQQMRDDFEDPNSAEAVINVDFDVDWKQTDVVFDVPSVTMRRHDISFDIPEVTMNRKDMSFDTPSVRMVNKKVGEYPCFKRWKWYSCDIITKVPEVFMERQRIAMDIPEVTMKRQDLSFDLPEFFMTRVDWSLHLPQFTVKSVTAEVQQMEEKANSLKARGEQIGRDMKAEIDAIVAGGFGQGAQTVLNERDAIAQPFNDAIAQISRTIDDLVARKIDPVKVPADGGNINLRKTLEDVIVKRDSTLQEFDRSTAPTDGAYLARHEHDAEEPSGEQRELEPA